MKKKVLIVEDIHSIRLAISDMLGTSFDVYGASCFDEGIEILSAYKIDLVITDIKMPGKSGLDLIDYVKQYYHDTQYALITAYNINDYIHFAREYSVWNIIPKYSSLDLEYIHVMVKKLLFNDIFGIDKYFPNLNVFHIGEDKPFEAVNEGSLNYKTIKSDKERVYLCERIGKSMVEKGAPRIIHQVIEELTSNAMIRAPRDSKGNSKYQYELPSRDLIIALENIVLSDMDYFEIGYGIIDGIFIITTRDKFGALRKEEILHRLDRHTKIDPDTNLPLGVNDSHGRGLFICREISDQIIFNIHKNQRTEIIALVNSKQSSAFKSLSIFEIEMEEKD
jgi:CheY-like chemotaxis protein